MGARMKAKSSEGWTWELSKFECQRRGWHVERVSWTERFPRPGGKLVTIQRDLLAAFDALAWPEKGIGVTFALQITGDSGKPGGGRAARRRKLAEHPLREMLEDAGWSLRVWAWRMKGQQAVLAEDVL